MSKKTEDLIEQLAAAAEPVYCLGSPFRRTLIWFAWSMPWIAAGILIWGLRADIKALSSDVRWLIEEGAALATAIMAAMAAFCAGVPGRPHWEHYIPLMPLAIWMGILVQGCVQDWLALGSISFVLRPDWQCILDIAVLGLGPAIAITFMILRGSPIEPTTTTSLGALAAGSLAAAALRLIHREDNSLMILVWQVGAVFGLVFLGGIFGRRILRWRVAGAS